MALIRNAEIATMTKVERREKLAEVENQLMFERGAAAMGGLPASPGRIRALRKNIARLKTALRMAEIRKAKQGAV